MTDNQIEELLRLTKENNIMLRYIVKKWENNNSDSFLLNVLADVIVDKSNNRN